MHKKHLVIVGLVMGIVAAACAPAAPPEPSAEPAPADPTWDRIQASGKMLVGTSGDYRPFAYYDENFVLTGFDVALIQAVGMRMGVPVEVRDFAFDGLGTALQIGQVDAAIAAVSITEERQEVVDFSNVYYIGAGAAVAEEGSGIGPLTSLEQLVQYRIGVQDASVYQTEMQNLVELGRMQPANLLSYVRADDGTRAVLEGAIDVFLMDEVAAEDAVAAGGLELAGTGVAQQRFAIAVPKGSPILLAKINQALIDLNNDGSLARLTQEYLRIAPEDQAVLPTPVPSPTATAGPTATQGPTRTPAPGACVDGMAFVADLNFDDENMKDPPELAKGESFKKGWRLRNVGTCTWTEDYSIRFVYGNVPEAKMDGKTTYVVGEVKPGQTYDMYVSLKAPEKSGTFQGFWQMFNGNGQAFGETVWVGIRVPGPTPTPTSTSKPQPTATPVPATATSVPPTAGPTPPFDGATYELDQWMATGEGEMQPVVDGTTVDLMLNPDRTFEGSAGCNTYNGNYTVQGANITLNVSAVTRLACSDPAGVMEQENAYLNLLDEVTMYQFENPSLYFLGPGETQDEVMLEFARR